MYLVIHSTFSIRGCCVSNKIRLATDAKTMLLGGCVS